MRVYTSTGDTTLSTGTGTLTGRGVPPTGYQSLLQAAVADQDTPKIRISTKNNVLWEVCATVYDSATKQYTRGELSASSTGSRIDFPAGVKNIYIVLDVDQTAQGVLTTQGDLLTVDDSGNLVTIPAGDPGQVLTYNGAGELPTPQDVSLNVTGNPGEILYFDSDGNLAKLPPGTAGQVVAMDSGLPSWQNASGGSDTPYIFCGCGNIAPFHVFIPAQAGSLNTNNGAYPSSYSPVWGATKLPFNATLSSFYFEGDRNSDGTDELDIYINGTLALAAVIVANGQTSGTNLIDTISASNGDYVSAYYTGGGNFNKMNFSFIATKA